MGEFPRQLGDMRTDRLDAENAVIVLARNDAHEALGAIHAECTPVCSERKQRNDSVLGVLVGRQQAGADNLRLRETDGWYGRRFETAAMACDDLRYHLALLRRLVLEHRFADE